MGRRTRRCAINPGSTARCLLAAVVLALAGAGCNNACQATCQPVAEFSRECGYSVSDAEVDACIDAQADVTEEDLESCRTYGNPRAVDDTLTCEDLPLLWGEVDAGDET